MRLDLPPVPRKGWPWTISRQPLALTRPDGSPWPKLSIVIPSYNQGEFLEETLRSVLLQGYPNLEVIVIDGGSRDNSVTILEKYAPWLSYWVSEPDRGQSHAINKGFQRATGDYLAWMNSDDCYLADALATVFSRTRADFSYGPTYVGADLDNCRLVEGLTTFKLPNLVRFFEGLDYIIPSQSVFVSRKLLEQVGLLREDLNYCMDLEWFLRIARQNPTVYRQPQPICFYRIHPKAKTTAHHPTQQEARQLARDYRPYLAPADQRALDRRLAYAQVWDQYLVQTPELASLWQTLRTLPQEALADRRFLGLVKRQLFGNNS